MGLEGWWQEGRIQGEKKTDLFCWVETWDRLENVYRRKQEAREKPKKGMTDIREGNEGNSISAMRGITGFGQEHNCWGFFCAPLSLTYISVQEPWPMLGVTTALLIERDSLCNWFSQQCPLLCTFSLMFNPYTCCSCVPRMPFLFNFISLILIFQLSDYSAIKNNF